MGVDIKYYRVQGCSRRADRVAICEVRHLDLHTSGLSSGPRRTRHSRQGACMFCWGSMPAEQWFKAVFLVFQASVGGQPINVELGGCSKKRTGGALLPGPHAGLRLLACIE